LIVAIIESTMSECSYWMAVPSRRPRVSPYARNENLVTPADAASDGSGWAGGVMARTVSGDCAAGTARSPNATAAAQIRTRNETWKVRITSVLQAGWSQPDAAAV